MIKTFMLFRVVQPIFLPGAPQLNSDRMVELGSRPSLEAAAEYAKELQLASQADGDTILIFEELARVRKETIKTPKIELTVAGGERKLL